MKTDPINRVCGFAEGVAFSLCVGGCAYSVREEFFGGMWGVAYFMLALCGAIIVSNPAFYACRTILVRWTEK